MAVALARSCARLPAKCRVWLTDPDYLVSLGAAEHGRAGRMKSDNKKTRRRAVSKNATAPVSASRAKKPKPRTRPSDGASMVVRDTRAKQPSKGRQRIKS